MKSIAFLFFVLCSFTCLAQLPTQNIRGRVSDNESQFPLIGAKIELDLKDPTGVNYRAITDNDGNFTLSKVPVGKYALTTRLPQYEPKTLTIELSSGRELILTISLQELVNNKDEVVVSGRKKARCLMN